MRGRESKQAPSSRHEAGPPKKQAVKKGESSRPNALEYKAPLREVKRETPKRLQ